MAALAGKVVLPSVCCRCLGAADATWAVRGSDSARQGNTLYTTTRKIDVPICRACKDLYVRRALIALLVGAVCIGVASPLMRPLRGEIAHAIGLVLVVVGGGTLAVLVMAFATGFGGPAFFRGEKLTFWNKRYQAQFDELNR